MKFEFIEYNKKATDEELLADLKRVAIELDKDCITQSEYNEKGQFHCDTVSKRFGSWNEALSIIGLKSGNQFFDKEDLFINLEKVWVKLGRQPVRRDMNNKEISSISSGAYLRRFKTWNNALRSFVEYINSEESKKDKPNEMIDNTQKNKHKTSRDVNLRLRFLVMKRDSFRCCACGSSPAKNPGVELHVDHIIPYSKGGETTYDNLQTLCSECNQGKGNLI